MLKRGSFGQSNREETSVSDLARIRCLRGVMADLDAALFRSDEVHLPEVKYFLAMARECARENLLLAEYDLGQLHTLPHFHLKQENRHAVTA